ncbi:ribosome maturation factor RimM [Sulfurimonas diazotrophicus]|uniref:Ribosome maturation factor RimM n=1 Tax=Sulfurimonas diazotrophicus TaxID=3131939 RepID=A0ABZ3HB59_9BACT
MSKRQNNDRLLHIATLGRTVGLHGEMKLHLFTDFPEQFVPGETFYTKERTPLRFETVNMERELVKLEGIETPEDAKRFTNVMLYTTYGRTREMCHLDEGEHFWFDLIGCTVMEDGVTLGKVLEIERIGAVDYLQIKTDDALTKQRLPKQFLLPKQPPFVESVDTDAALITAHGAMAILEES